MQQYFPLLPSKKRKGKHSAKHRNSHCYHPLRVQCALLEILIAIFFSLNLGWVLKFVRLGLGISIQEKARWSLRKIIIFAPLFLNCNLNVAIFALRFLRIVQFNKFE